jgi:D-alanyl-D-alanine carboxypeptidase
MEGDLTDPEALRRGYAMSELVDFAIEHGEPSFAPGAEGQWSYSNTGYILLGLIIEAIEGQPIAETFEARIFGPLGMEETFYATGVPTPEMGLPRAFVALALRRGNHRLEPFAGCRRGGRDLDRRGHACLHPGAPEQ